MCNVESCTATVKFRRPYTNVAKVVRCSELDPMDRARYGCPACRGQSPDTEPRACASAHSSSNTLISKAVSAPGTSELVISVAVRSLS